MIEYSFRCPNEEVEHALDSVQIQYAIMLERARDGKEVLSSETAKLTSLSREFAMTLARHLWAIEQGGTNAD